MDDKVEYYEKIMRDIAGHKDFGKRNPVDIGLECGYSEKDVLEMIRMCYSAREKAGQKEQEKYYFMLRRNRKRYIVSVDINTWEVETVKEVDESNSSLDIFQIKGNIFARVYHSDRKTMMWENLENGETGKFLTESDITSILILEEEIIVLTREEIIAVDLKKGGKCRACAEVDSSFGRIKMVEGQGHIYIIESYGYISVFDKELKNGKKITYDKPYGYHLIGVEYTEEGLSWYLCKEEVHFFSSSTWHYRKYSEKNPANYSSDSVGIYGSRVTSSFVETIRTKNYMLPQTEIYTIAGKEICNFSRKLPTASTENDEGQVVGIYDKDIFIGVTDKEELIKIDLRDERKPIILPYEVK